MHNLENSHKNRNTMYKKWYTQNKSQDIKFINISWKQWKKSATADREFLLWSRGELSISQILFMKSSLSL